MEGATVVIADVDDAPVGEVLSEIQRQRGQAFGMRCDVTDPRSVDTLFRTVGKRLGQVDVLVACAGILRFNLVQDITELEWDQVLDSHLKGSFLCAQAAQALMIPRRSGKMMFISSVAARGDPARAHYAAAKAGIEAMTRTLAIELGEFSINVNAVAPGFIGTRMPRQHAEWLGQEYEAFREAVIAKTPLKRVGTPDDLSAAIAFLCSDEASFITGETLCVSGGL
jgi:3-oxoacyl-[acyl-carrier protein] reductase